MSLVALQPATETVVAYAQQLFDHHGHYCQNISVADHAVSIQTAGYLLWLCKTTQPKIVADLGSGFSSYVLRRYALEADHEVTVHSVDHNELWMAKSEWFVTHHQLPTDGFMSGAAWSALGARYDLIFNDYSGGETRDEFAFRAVKRLTPSGVVVFDDAHHYGHRSHMAEACRRGGLVLLDLFHQTIDVMGRHAMIGARP